MSLKMWPVSKSVSFEQQNLSDGFRRGDKDRAEGSQLQANNISILLANSVKTIPRVSWVLCEQVKVADEGETKWTGGI